MSLVIRIWAMKAAFSPGIKQNISKLLVTKAATSDKRKLKERNLKIASTINFVKTNIAEY